MRGEQSSKTGKRTYQETKMPMSLDRKFFDKTAMPTALYGSEMWATTRRVRVLAEAQSRME
ncbi:unnamed protein product [Toxocara canis]|uniref:Uncharacterized protein n=1 Tax=Toxocara canis TaxID=6265 RepID=A0A183TVG5_TOXCA|nr:unnamed protein product [Toxocara canis]